MYFHFTSVLARLATERELRGNHAITSFALTQRFLSSRMRLRWLSVPCARLSIAVGFILNLRVNAVGSPFIGVVAGFLEKSRTENAFTFQY